MKTTYKGYIIELDNDPWAALAGLTVKLYPLDDQTGESTRYATDLQEAKEEIDEILNLIES